MSKKRTTKNLVVSQNGRHSRSVSDCDAPIERNKVSSNQSIIALDDFSKDELEFFRSKGFIASTVANLIENNGHSSSFAQLTDTGKDFFARIVSNIAHSDTLKPKKKREVPVWDGESRTLFFQGKTVKEFVRPATNQETILTVFQEENWKPILDPLAPRPEIDCKKRLNDAIRSLNRNQRNQCIKFESRGDGKKIKWKPINK